MDCSVMLFVFAGSDSEGGRLAPRPGDTGERMLDSSKCNSPFVTTNPLTPSPSFPRASPALLHPTPVDESFRLMSFVPTADSSRLLRIRHDTFRRKGSFEGHQFGRRSTTRLSTASSLRHALPLRQSRSKRSAQHILHLERAKFHSLLVGAVPR